MDYLVKTAEQLQDIVRGVRQKKRLTQQHTATLVGGLTQNAITNFERSPDTTSFGRVLAILSALGLELVVREAPETSKAPKGEW